MDPASRSIERWRPSDEEPEILFDEISWQPRADLSPLVIDFREYFRGVYREEMPAG